jgi:type VI protein secretion system component VasF
MTLLEIYEPLFEYICRLNRANRKGTHHEYAVVRGELKSLVEQIGSRALSDSRLSMQFKELEMPVMFFIDSMIAEGGLPFSSEWNHSRLAFASNELAGDQKFFDYLDDTMADQTEAASERLSIFYTMLGLGFTGWYEGQPEYLRKKMLEIAPRIRTYVQTDASAKLCPEAYDSVDTRDLIEPPSRGIALIAITFVVICITTLACNYYLFHKTTSSLAGYLKEVLQHEADFKSLSR